MLFTDPIFLFYFLPLSLILMRLFTRRHMNRSFPVTARLMLFSLTAVFYGFREPWWLIPFFICIGFDFFWASRIATAGTTRSRRLWLTMSIAQNVGLLALFKYRSFIWNNLIALGIRLPEWSVMLDNRSLALPAGISFYTFESLSFVIDVYRRDITPPKSASEFFGFIGMFPRFVAGPIVRYREMINQFERYRGMQIEPGLFLFIYGMFIKVVFGDNFEVFTRYAFGNAHLDFVGAWLGAMSYTFHIYFDFSGYSLMAIGLGRMLGFQFPTNFNRPYLALSAQDFWRRWHMSLSSWLRDYLYISLGGNRKGTWRTYLNLFLTMLIGGLWHGASWNFVVWGAFHGAWLSLERRFPIRGRLPPCVNQSVTLVVVCVGWVIFRSQGGESGPILREMFWPHSFAFNPEALRIHPISVAACLLGLWHCFWFEKRVDATALEERVVVTSRRIWLALAMLGTSLILGFSEKTIPFIYFQF